MQRNIEINGNNRDRWTPHERLISGRLFSHAKGKASCSFTELRRCTFVGQEDLQDVRRVLRMMKNERYVETKIMGKDLIITLTKAGQAIANSGKVY